MKYRTDFVTNSSSTSFGAAAVTALMGLLTSLGCTCGEQQPPQDGFIRLTKMPEDASKIVCGAPDPVWVYAQYVKVTEKGEEVDPAVTESISFSASGGGWTTLGSPTPVDGWQAVDVWGTPVGGGTAPTSVRVTASASVGETSATKSVSFTYEGLPAMKITPDKISFLSKTGESVAAKVDIAPAGPDPWEIAYELDSFAEKLCVVTKEDVSAQGDRCALTILEDDREDVTGTTFTNYYSKGKVKVTGTSGTDKEVKDTIDITIYREGLFISAGLDRESGALIVDADLGPDGKMKTASIDICYLRWNETEKTVKSDVPALQAGLIIGDPAADDEGAANVLRAAELTFEYERVRESNIAPAIYKVSLGKVVPGKPGERFKANVELSLETEEDTFTVTVPLLIRPAELSLSASWQQEYENCKKTINGYMPVSMREVKLAQLEKNKHYMGAEDLKMFRKECWGIARDAMVNEAQSYLDDAAWYDTQVKRLEWTVWLTDRAFAVVAGTVFGPMGAYAAGLAKNSIADVIVKCEENWDKDWYTIGTEIAWSRLVDAAGSGIDAYKFSEPAVAAAWIAAYCTYKFVWHLAFDKDDAGKFKGVVEALKATGWDITGVGLEKGLEPFIKSKAARDGLKQIQNLDELVKDTIGCIKALLPNLTGA